MSTYLVTGGTGKTGRRIAARLAAFGHDVRVGSRAGTPPFDWDDPTTWAPALAGVDAAYLAFAPELALPGAAEKVGALARLAVDGGVRRLVLLSGRGEPGAEAGERAVFGSGADVVVVRSAFFAQNFDEGDFAPAIAAGELVLPAAELNEPFVDLDDVADVAVAGLVGDLNPGEVYEVTGPRVLSFGEVSTALSAAADHPVVVRSGSVAESAELLAAAAQVPAEVATGIAELFAEVLDGRNAHVSDGVERALGRPARDFSDYVDGVATWTA